VHSDASKTVFNTLFICLILFIKTTCDSRKIAMMPNLNFSTNYSLQRNEMVKKIGMVRMISLTSPMICHYFRPTNEKVSKTVKVNCFCMNSNSLTAFSDRNLKNAMAHFLSQRIWKVLTAEWCFAWIPSFYYS